MPFGHGCTERELLWKKKKGPTKEVMSKHCVCNENAIKASKGHNSKTKKKKGGGFVEERTAGEKKKNGGGIAASVNPRAWGKPGKEKEIGGGGEGTIS